MDKNVMDGVTPAAGERRLPDISDVITVVRTREHAQQVLERLKYYESNTSDGKQRYWACDTEVADIDVKTQGPVGNGYVICLSIYGGPDVDFGDGPGAALWIDNHGEAEGVLQEFKGWLEDESILKVWHNYGFDRHVVNNEDIDLKGFGGDTMHMARLLDTSRDRVGSGGKGYSLESLSEDLIEDDRFAKVSMKELFGVAKLKKDGTPSLVKVLPGMEEIQSNPESREGWIQYSARDAIATWLVWDVITKELQDTPWYVEGRLLGSLHDFYTMYLKDFGELLTDMEANGIRVDVDGHLKQAETLARKERARLEKEFLEWASEYCDGAHYLNIASSQQLQQFFFGQYKVVDRKPVLDKRERVFKVEKTEEELAFETAEVASANPYAGKTIAELKDLLRERELKLSGKKPDLVARLLENDVSNSDSSSDGGGLYGNMPTEELMDVCIARGLTWDTCGGDATKERESMLDALHKDALYMQDVNRAAVESSGKVLEKPKKFRELVIKTLGFSPKEFTPAGQPQANAPALRRLAGPNGLAAAHATDSVAEEDDTDEGWAQGLAFKHMGGGEKGRAACRAIGALATIGQIDATITNFLVPLQLLADKDSRIHCSLNLNTETGRLSSRRPNLQNQPALEKDSFKVC